jgi:hypothetical protein
MRLFLPAAKIMKQRERKRLLSLRISILLHPKSAQNAPALMAARDAQLCAPPIPAKSNHWHQKRRSLMATFQDLEKVSVHL